MTGTRAPIAGAIGKALRAVFRLIVVLRRPRPIHAHGTVLDGHVVWLGTSVVSGIEWIDAPSAGARVDVIGRLSRSVGLPRTLPDVLGLALRVQQDGRAADIELASTGLGVPSRFLLLPRWSPSRVNYGTLLPYRTDAGPILLCARQVPGVALPTGGAALDDALSTTPWRLRLMFATPRGRWHPFADVVLQRAPDQNDGHLRFDAVRRILPGADTYRWVRAVRQPSYEMVRGDATRLTTRQG